MLYFNGSDAAVAAADPLMAQAGMFLAQHASARMNDGEQMLPLQNLSSSRGKQIDRYLLEQVLLSRDPSWHMFCMAVATCVKNVCLGVVPQFLWRGTRCDCGRSPPDGWRHESHEASCAGGACRACKPQRLCNQFRQEYGSVYRKRCAVEFSRCRYIQAGQGLQWQICFNCGQLQVAMDAGTVAGTSHMHFAMFSPEMQMGAILPQQASRQQLT